MNAFIVIPTYNEAANLDLLISKILELHPDFHIVVVDDNSPDGTGEMADKLAQKDKRVEVIHRPAKLGLGTALCKRLQACPGPGSRLGFRNGC